MALGFQDCCNSSSYFLLEGIPATVSEFEVYYIQTAQGETFCATYVNLPALNYSPPIYTLLEMTEQGAVGENTACDVCVSVNPCPSEETIFLSQFGTGSIAIGTDCFLKTVFPMVVTCSSVNPDFDTNSNGSVGLFVVGGTAPYAFYDLDNEQYISSPTVSGNIFILKQNVPEGTYRFRVADSQADFVQVVECVLDAPSPPPVVSCVTQPSTVFGAPYGQITNLVIEGGTPPYTIEYLGNPVTFPLTNLAAGNYNFVITDSGTNDGDSIQYVVSHTCTVGDGPSVFYSNAICLTFTFCGQLFYLTFNKTSNFINYRPTYLCDATLANILGITDPWIIQWDNNYNGWITNNVTTNGNIQLTSAAPCPLSTTTVGLSKSSTSSPSETPQSGSWYGTGFLANINVTAQINACVIVYADPTITANVLTSACVSENQLGSVQLVGNSFIPAPNNTLTYRYRPLPGGTYVDSPTGGLLNLPAGPYQAFCVDSDGNGSSIVNFTIQSEPVIPISFAVTCLDQEFQNNNNDAQKNLQLYSDILYQVQAQWSNILAQVLSYMEIQVTFKARVGSLGQGGLSNFIYTITPNLTSTNTGTDVVTTPIPTSSTPSSDTNWQNTGCVNVNDCTCGTETGVNFEYTRVVTYTSPDFIFTYNDLLQGNTIVDYKNSYNTYNYTCEPYMEYTVNYNLRVRSINGVCGALSYSCPQSPITDFNIPALKAGYRQTKFGTATDSTPDLLDCLTASLPVCTLPPPPDPNAGGTFTESILTDNTGFGGEAVFSEGNNTNLSPITCFPCDVNYPNVSVKVYRYPIIVDFTIAGLGNDDAIQGYFEVTLKLQNAFSESCPDCISTDISQLENTSDFFQLITPDEVGFNPNDGYGGFTYNNYGSIETPFIELISETETLYSTRENNLNVIHPNFLTPGQNNGCFTLPSGNNLTNDQQTEVFEFIDNAVCEVPDLPSQFDDNESLEASFYSNYYIPFFNGTRIQTKTYYVGSQSAPITFYNGTGQFKIFFQGRFRPTDTEPTCPPAKGFQWEIKFIRTSSPTLPFNYYGEPYVDGNPQPYIGSMKQVGNTQFPDAITNERIIY